MTRSISPNIHFQRGASLVEALVALVIVVVGVVPAIYLSTSALNVASSIRNSLIAANLTQEGVEVVRAIRDANWFNALPFESGLTACAAGCRVQWDSTTPLALAGNPYLLINSFGVYNYAIGTPTAFQRMLTITPVGTPIQELLVTSEVTWFEHGRSRQIKAESHLFNWR